MPKRTNVVELIPPSGVARAACPRCEGLVAAEHVHYGAWRRYRGTRGCEERMVTVHCDHCNDAFTLRQRMYG